MDALDINSPLYWARFELSARCFESDSNLSEPVHVVDVPPSLGARTDVSGMMPLKENVCDSLRSLEDYLGDSANADYTLRFMQVTPNTQLAFCSQQPDHYPKNIRGQDCR